MSRSAENTGRTGGPGNRRGFYESWAVKGTGGPVNPSPPQYAVVNRRSLKKDGNRQAQQWRVNPASLNSERNDGSNVHAGSQSPASSTGSSDGLTPKPLDRMNAIATRESLSSQASTTRAPHTSVQRLPLEVPGYASTPSLLQFGSINAGIMNHLPAKNDTSRAVPMPPVPTSQKQQRQPQTRKDAHSKSTVLPIDATPRPMPSQQVQVPLRFGGSSPQVQSESVATSAVKTIPTLPVGNGCREIHPATHLRGDVKVVVSSPPTLVPPKSSDLAVTSIPKPLPVQQFGQCCNPGLEMKLTGVTANTVQRMMSLPVANAPKVVNLETLSDRSAQLSKPFTEPFDKNSESTSHRQSSEVPPLHSMQREPVRSMSVPDATVGECGSIMTGVDGGDREPVQTSEDCAAPSIASLTTSIPISSSSSLDNITSDGSVNKQKVSETARNSEHKFAELPDGDTIPLLLSEPKHKSSTETKKQKNKHGKKKKRNNAHKGIEQRKENASTSESVDSSLTVDHEQILPDVPHKNSVASESAESRGELDDWEFSADIYTPELKTSENSDEFRKEVPKKMNYSRDFLLTFAKMFTELPKGLEIGSDIAEAFMSAPGGSSRELHPNSGRMTDMRYQPLRDDHRMSGILDDRKWNKLPGTFGPGVDGPSTTSFRPNHGVLRNPLGRPSHQFADGILNGPTRSNADTDRWQHASTFQKGLIPPPQTPLQVMHKAERKYEVGKVSDIEEAKQRHLKAILNKLTPENFEKLFEKVIDVNIDTVVTLTGVISQIFDKALMEPTFCEMYADFCLHLADALPDFTDNSDKITFKRLLLNKCQEEFEKGEKEQADAVEVKEGEIKHSEDQWEERRLRARRRMLGNIRFIGELYKKKMITERIMHNCIRKLFGPKQDPDEEDIELLCKLMATIGEIFDNGRVKEHMDSYFALMQKLSTSQKLSSRVRFMLKDVIDLRKNKWQQRRKTEGPKKIEQVHIDAASERQAQTSRFVRGPVTGYTMRRGAPPINYVPRGSTELPSSSRYIQSIPSQVHGPLPSRGYAQDVRLVNNQHESTTLSVPLSQQPTYGPQCDLSRVASTRGQSLISSVPAEINSRRGDTLRTPSSSIGRCSKPCLASTSALPFSSRPRTPEAKPLSEGALREKSISAIREFYSAKDEKEIALCVKELNTPSFYPSMVSIWVMDSFERKDLERELLSKLLVNLCKSNDSLFTHIQLIDGFEYVLSLLEDAVNDAPRAGEFLGRIFATIILDNVASLREIAALIHQGGEEPGRLLEVGLASEVLGSILEAIRSEKGDTVLKEIMLSSAIQLEDFKLPNTTRTKLDAFL